MSLVSHRGQRAARVATRVDGPAAQAALAALVDDVGARERSDQCAVQLAVQLATVRPEPPFNDASEENLLIEAISLLVERQRDAEAWLADQISHAEERTATTERRYTELESRLEGIEDQLKRLVRELEPSGMGVSDERLARLREQVEGLKSVTDARSERSQPPPRLPSPQSTPPRERPQGSTISDVIGRTSADRFGSFLIAIGALAVVYAIFSQFALR